MHSDVPGIEGFLAKFKRGKTHARQLRDEITHALDGYSYPVRVETDEGARQYVLYIESVPDTSQEWSLLFGDAIHNFRSTLDHIAVQLAIHGNGSALTDDEVRTAAFPVLDDPNSWSTVAGPPSVRLMRPGERDRIRELQPFNATEQSIWGRDALLSGGARIPRVIRELHRADIADKHRYIHPSWHAVKGVDLPPVEGVTAALAHGQRLEPGAEVGRWMVPGDVPTPLPALPSGLDVSRYFPLGVEFPESGFGYSMLDFLDEVEDLIERLIKLFAPALTKGDPVPPVTSLLS